MTSKSVCKNLEGLQFFSSFQPQSYPQGVARSFFFCKSLETSKPSQRWPTAKSAKISRTWNVRSRRDSEPDRFDTFEPQNTAIQNSNPNFRSFQNIPDFLVKFI